MQTLSQFYAEIQAVGSSSLLPPQGEHTAVFLAATLDVHWIAAPLWPLLWPSWGQVLTETLWAGTEWELFTALSGSVQGSESRPPFILLTPSRDAFSSWQESPLLWLNCNPGFYPFNHNHTPWTWNYSFVVTYVFSLKRNNLTWQSWFEIILKIEAETALRNFFTLILRHFFFISAYLLPLWQCTQDSPMALQGRGSASLNFSYSSMQRWIC